MKTQDYRWLSTRLLWYTRLTHHHWWLISVIHRPPTMVRVTNRWLTSVVHAYRVHLRHVGDRPKAKALTAPQDTPTIQLTITQHATRRPLYDRSKGLATAWRRSTDIQAKVTSWTEDTVAQTAWGRLHTTWWAILGRLQHFYILSSTLILLFYHL